MCLSVRSFIEAAGMAGGRGVGWGESNGQKARLLLFVTHFSELLFYRERKKKARVWIAMAGSGGMEVVQTVALPLFVQKLEKALNVEAFLKHVGGIFDDPFLEEMEE